MFEKIKNDIMNNKSVANASTNRLTHLFEKLETDLDLCVRKHEIDQDRVSSLG